MAIDKISEPENGNRIFGMKPMMFGAVALVITAFFISPFFMGRKE